jgi:hypothetical protein
MYSNLNIYFWKWRNIKIKKINTRSKINKCGQQWNYFKIFGVKLLNRGRDCMDLQLPVQSVPITTKVVSSNSAQGEVYSIQHYVIKFVSDLRPVRGFLKVHCLFIKYFGRICLCIVYLMMNTLKHNGTHDRISDNYIYYNTYFLYQHFYI